MIVNDAYPIPVGLSGVEWGGAGWGCHVYSINYPCSNTLCNELRTIPLTGPEERKQTSFSWMCTYARSQLKSPTIAQLHTRWAAPKVKKGMFLALHARDMPLMQGMFHIMRGEWAHHLIPCTSARVRRLRTSILCTMYCSYVHYLLL